jgi:hypothetical protein
MQNHGYLCGVYDLQVINGWKVPLEVQQLGCHVLSYGYWENFGEKRQVLHNITSRIISLSSAKKKKSFHYQQ